MKLPYPRPDPGYEVLWATRYYPLVSCTSLAYPLSITIQKLVYCINILYLMGLVHITYNTYKVVSFWPKICYTYNIQKMHRSKQTRLYKKQKRKKFVLFFHHEDESALPLFYFGKGYPSPMQTPHLMFLTPIPPLWTIRNFGLSHLKTSKSRRLLNTPGPVRRTSLLPIRKFYFKSFFTKFSTRKQF